MPDLFVFVSALLALAGCHLIYNLLLSPMRKVPGPLMAALSPLYMKYFTIIGKRAFKIHELHEKYGPVIRIAPAEISTSHLPAVREIYSIKSDFMKTAWYQRFTSPSLSNIFTMADRSEHRQRRSLLAHGFSATALASMEPLIDARVKMAVSKIKRDLYERKARTDVLKWWMCMASDVIGELAFGECFHALDMEEESTYLKTLQATNTIGGIGAEFYIPLNVFNFLGKLIPESKLKDILCASERANEYGSQAIREFASTKVRVSDDSEKPTILAKIMGAKDNKTGATLSMMDIRNEATGMIVAGTDTTAITLTYLVWYILKHLDIRRRLHSELSTLPPDFTDSDLQNLPYLSGVIKEALRLYGAAPGSLPRVVPSGGIEVNGYKIPAGTVVSSQAYTLHRDSKYFPDPLKFDPDRWFAPTQEMKHAFMPFGGGSRVCLGQNLAQIELRLAIAHFLLACPDAKVAESCTDESMEFENYFLVFPKSHRCEITC